MIRVGFFYDGSFFHRVSSFYKHNSARQAFLSFGGLQEYIRKAVADVMGKELDTVQITESHLHRGRFSITAAKEKSTLETDRFFDQMLMYAGVQPHYLPMDESRDRPAERGVEINMALDIYEMAVQKRIDIAVIFSGNADITPLIRKLHAQGVATMIVGVDLESESDDGKIYTTRTSSHLMDVCTYPMMLSEDIESNLEGIDDIFAKVR